MPVPGKPVTMIRRGAVTGNQSVLSGDFIGKPPVALTNPNLQFVGMRFKERGKLLVVVVVFQDGMFGTVAEVAAFERVDAARYLEKLAADALLKAVVGHENGSACTESAVESVEEVAYTAVRDMR